MKQLKNVTGPKCALPTRCLRGRPTAEEEEEGKEKTQEFKIPVARRPPPARGRTLRRTTLPRTIRDYGVDLRAPAAFDEAFPPTSSSSLLHDP